MKNRPICNRSETAEKLLNRLSNHLGNQVQYDNDDCRIMSVYIDSLKQDRDFMERKYFLLLAEKLDRMSIGTLADYTKANPYEIAELNKFLLKYKDALNDYKNANK